jgi:hypothetical protein
MKRQTASCANLWNSWQASQVCSSKRLLLHHDRYAALLACNAAHNLTQIVLREALAGPEAHVLGSSRRYNSNKLLGTFSLRACL